MTITCDEYGEQKLLWWDRRTQKGGLESASWCLCSHISPDTSKDQTKPGSKYYRLLHLRECVGNGTGFSISLKQTNLTNLYLRVTRVLLPNFSHSRAECFHQSLVLEVEQIEFLRHPVCPTWASCLSCWPIKTWVVFFKSFTISFETLVVYLSDVFVSVNLVQRKNGL